MKPCQLIINPRFWDSLQLATDVGLELPYLLYRMTRGEKLQPPPPHKEGFRLRWLLGDLDRLYLVLKSPDYSLGEKFHQALSFLNFLPRNTRYEVNRFGDMKTLFMNLRKYIREIVV